MRKETEFTIVTPSYNQSKFIEATIQSVIGQQYPNLEYIVVDGVSRDGSVEIVKKFEDKITRWVSEPDAGQSDAINKGVAMATGEWIGWINSDDMLAEGALQILADSVQQNPDWRNMFMGRYLEVDIDGNVISEKHSDIRTLESLVDIPGSWRKKGGNQIGQQGMFFSKRLYEKAGGLRVENHRSMDYELWGRMLLAGGRIVPVDAVLGIFRTYEGQKISDRYITTKSLVNDAQSLIKAADWPAGKKRKYFWKNRFYWWKFRYHHLRSLIGVKRRFKELF
ncbi:MAG: glycosyltransferase [Bacteroidetes bacterium]|nr:MAG: glycosyltransferase [Bacteroidota bacterium]